MVAESAGNVDRGMACGANPGEFGRGARICGTVHGGFGLVGGANVALVVMLAGERRTGRAKRTGVGVRRHER